MARTRRIKAEGAAFYHVTSRITGKQFLLKDPEVKKLMLSALERSAKFSGVEIGSFCLMDDHFHILLHIPSFDAGTLPDSELLDRIEILAGKKRADILHDRWEHLISNGNTPLAEAEKQRWRRRMYDLSEFVKTFKEEFRRAYQREHDYSGRLWGDRFFSTLIEDSEHLKNCAAYIEMNPVRAKMVQKATDYAWNSSGLALLGNEFARECREWLMEYAGLSGGISLDGDTPLKESWVMRRVPQMSKGKILGKAAFVTEAIAKYQNKLNSHRARARVVVEGMFASHGYRLAGGGAERRNVA
jgi:REP element-mobilizing transposase RayT